MDFSESGFKEKKELLQCVIFLCWKSKKGEEKK